MKNFIIDIEVSHKPIDELLTPNKHIVLDFDDLENMENCMEITLEDIDLDLDSDIDDLEEENFDEDDFDENFQEEIELDDIDIDFDETYE